MGPVFTVSLIPILPRISITHTRHFELEKTIAESVSTMASKKSSVTIYIGGVTLVRSVSTKCREQKVSP